MWLCVIQLPSNDTNKMVVGCRQGREGQEGLEDVVPGISRLCHPQQSHRSIRHTYINEQQQSHRSIRHTYINEQQQRTVKYEIIACVR